MLETLIASYISTLNEDLVMEYAKKQGYILEEKEAKIITQFLKKNWRPLLKQESACLQDLKGKVKEETYQIAFKLYQEAVQTYL